MLGSPDHVVVGSRDPAVTAAFLRVLGFTTATTSPLAADAAAVLGATEGVPVVDCRAGGRERGRILLVETSHPPPQRGPFDTGCHALDLYTTDVERSVALARDAGAQVGPVGSYAAGELPIREAKALGPDGLPIVFIETPRRRPSLLDDEPERLHSEVHSIVWAVSEVEAAEPFWTGPAGLHRLVDFTLADPAIASFMGLPRPDAAVRLALLCDAEATPSRLELLAFPDDEGATVPALPLAAGCFLPGFTVDDVDAATFGLDNVSFGSPFELDGTRCIVGQAPAGVGLLLRPVD